MKPLLLITIIIAILAYLVHDVSNDANLYKINVLQDSLEFYKYKLSNCK